MEGPIKQLYEKDGNEFKPIRACDGEGGSGSGGGTLPDSISAEATAYAAETATAEAQVDSTTGLFSFTFGLPKGADGKDGKDGVDGINGKDGLTPVAHKTVIIFQTATDKPSTPVGGVWDVEANTVTIPDGWVTTDSIEAPVWMSIGEFTSTDPDAPVWTDPIRITGQDGVNGTDGTSIEFIYKLSTVELSAPDDTPANDANTTDYIPDGWSDRPTGITEDSPYEYVCTRKKDIETGLWGDWAGPVLWSKWGLDGRDGDGVEYIYKRNTGLALENPTPSDYETNADYQNASGEYVPDGWTDNPTGVDEDNTHEWICVRKQKEGVWGAFSTPALWAKYGENGSDGTNGADGSNGISVRTMYAGTSGSDDVPVFVTDNIYPGSIWSLTLPSSETYEAIWAIQAYVTSDNKLATVTLDDGTEVYGWQGPILITGTPGADGVPVNYKTYVYKLADSKPSKPTGDDPENVGDDWIDYPNTTGQWWQCIGTVNGQTGLIATDDSGALMWSEVLPVNGQDGTAQDGKRVEFRFAVNDSNTTAPTIDVTLRAPSGWTTQPPTKESSQYMWMTSTTINPDDTLYENWSTPVCISGEQGPQGNTGPAGPTGPTGPAGVSGVPGVDIQAKYCLGTADTYNATYDDTVANTLDPVSYGWAAVIPSVTEEYPYIWCIQTSIVYTRNADDDEVFDKALENPWSTPFRLTGINGLDGKGVGISSVDEYYLVSSLSSGVTTSSTGWQKNSIPAFTDTAIYLWNYEVINYEDGSSATPTAPAIIGSKGIDGADGADGAAGADGRGIVSVTEKYLASASTSGITSSSSGWSTSVPTTTAAAPYLWNWEHIVYTDGTTDDFIAIIGSRGADGADGKDGADGQGGQMIYPAGIYSTSTSYTATSTKAPYVYDSSDGNYYVMNYIGTWTGTSQNNLTPSQSYAANGGTYWMLMESFDAIYANVGVIANGLVGSAVFNGNYMFSQQGIDASGAATSAYENFNASDPYNSSNSFRPNLCFNLATGEAWFGAGAINLGIDGTGTINMSSGYDQEAMGSLGTFISQNKLEFANAAVRLRVGDESADKGVFALSSAVTTSDGGASEQIIINVYTDGSGYIGRNQELSWSSDGVVYIGGMKITSEGIGTNSPGSVTKSAFIGKDGIINAGTITTELVVSTNYSRYNTLKYDGQTLSVESTGTGPDGGNPSFSNLVYFKFEDVIFKITQFGIYGSNDGGSTFVDLLEGGGSASNVQFVSSLPSSPDSNTLYVQV